jgi:hypothetical protein
VLPGSADHVHLDALAREHGRRFEPLSNPSIEAQLQPGERYFLTTLGHCDCGTPLGALAQAARRAPDWAAQEQRLLRKGWSKAKVARAIAQKQEGVRTSAAASARTTLETAAGWVAFIRAVLASGKTSHLGLLLHMYSGSIEGRVELEGRHGVRPGDLTGEFLGQLKEDVLYVFRGQAE